MTPELTANLIRFVAPTCKEPNHWGLALAAAMRRYNIAGDLNVVAAFMAQILVESDQLNRVAENLFYTPDRLMQVWPKRFPDLSVAHRYARNPEALANYVYADRMGNGPEAGGDGWKYRGRGPIQITGKANYLAAEREMGIPLVKKPELLEFKENGALAAASFWTRNKLSFLAADLPDDDQAKDFATISRIVNGGTEGLVRREAFHKNIRTFLGLK